MAKVVVDSAASLKSWRARRGLSQEEAADIVGRSRRMYQYLEAGTRPQKREFPRDVTLSVMLYESGHPVKVEPEKQ